MSYTAVTKCRICDGTDLPQILDLGIQCLTGVFPKSVEERVPSGPLRLVKCASCHLVQLAHNYAMNLLYGENYGYRSGLNRSMVKHLHEKVARIVGAVALTDHDVVLDIGSNDSTLLQGYTARNIDLVGMDPTGVKFRGFYPPHIKLVPEFFSADAFLAHTKGRRAKVITSIAMFYDLERPEDFAHQVAESLADDGIWVFEQSYLPAMLDANSYDTVCHEHLEYYALRQVKRLLDRVGMKIVDVEFNDVNGGSFSVMAAHRNAPRPEAQAMIDRVLEDEEKRALSSIKPFREFAERTAEHRKEVLSFFARTREDKKSVFGYGASTKGNVMLQYCGLTEKDIPCIAEVNEDKFGAFTPGSRIPIVPEEQARRRKPDYFFVLPWHFRQGIVAREGAYLAAGGSLVFPLPRFQVVSRQAPPQPG